MEVLDRLGLLGPAQRHVSPVVLAIDERAHQVFDGFGSNLASVAEALTRRLPGASTCFVIRGHARQVTTLLEASKGSWGAEDTLVVPATRTDHPGGFYGLVWIVDKLLGPGGCPWDQAQTHESLKRHLIEESYELVDAIDADDHEKMVEELGDVLLQPVMHTQIECLAGNWDIEAACKAISDKLVRRHPHVFGDVSVENADEVLKNWDAIKAAEKSDKDTRPKSILEGVPRSMPALLRAFEVSKRAARAGFEWQDLDGVWEKFREEEAELREAIDTGQGISSEIGDMLFTLVNVARWLKVEPEDALRTMVDRFTERFQAMERTADKPLSDLSFGEWDGLWNSAKGL